MQEINLVCGSEKKFADFISKMGDEKIALISHNDLDGIASAKVVNEVVDTDIKKFINYTDINLKLVEELKKEKVERIIFTDIFIKDESFIQELVKFADVLIIDHHQVLKDWNSDKVTYLCCYDFCATYLSYLLFSKTQNIEKLDWLVTCACVSDWLYFKNQDFMKRMFEKYGDNFQIGDEGIRKSGKIWELQYTLSLAIIYWNSKQNVKKVFDSIGDKYGDIGDLKESAIEVKSEVAEKVVDFENVKEGIPTGFYAFQEYGYPIKSIVINELSSRHWNDTLIIVTQSKSNSNMFTVSTRRSDGKIDLNALLSKITRDLQNASGGGHKNASGGYFLKRDLDLFKEKLIKELSELDV